MNITLEDRMVDMDPLDVLNRGVAFALSDTRALVAWHKPWDAMGNDLIPNQGGLSLYSVAANGALGLVQTIPFTSQVRVVYNVP